MIYTLGEPVHDTPRFEGDTIHITTSYDVLRDGILVARIYDNPANYGGRMFVNLTKIRWAGSAAMPSGYPKNPDMALFFDYVSEFKTAAEALPECGRRVDRIIEWRRANA